MSVENGVMTRRRFRAVASAGAAMAAARTPVMPVAAQTPGLAQRFEEAARLLRAHTDSGDVAAAVLYVRRAGHEMSRAFGAARIDLPFLIASPTKPMTASGVMWLRDRRELALSDPVRKYLPAFQGGDRGEVTIGHLLTHMSGLPDMLPENIELRRQHAPLSEFVARTCRTPLLFRPGHGVSYQSMGVLLAAAIVAPSDPISRTL
jgi:CubicO group peptidase (beta-lactamase class C family)